MEDVLLLKSDILDALRNRIFPRVVFIEDELIRDEGFQSLPIAQHADRDAFMSTMFSSTGLNDAKLD